jgi:hypothetical protein
MTEKPFSVMTEKPFSVSLQRTVMSHTNVSEQLFEQFCQVNGVQCRKVSSGRRRTPDYEVRIRGSLLVCEVKQIDPNPEEIQAFKRAASGQYGHFWIGNRVRDKLKDVSTQLKSSAASGIPTMLVVYNNTPAFEYTEHSKIVQAMFGQKSQRLSSREDGEPQLSPPFFGGNRGMTPNQNTAISVLAALYRGGGDQLRLRMYHNPFAAVPLPPETFDGLPVEKPSDPI